MILIHAEHSSGTLRKAALELVSAARQLAAELDTQVTAAVFGAGAGTAAAELAAFVPDVLVSEAAEFDSSPEALVTALQQLALSTDASVILLSAGHAGLAAAPRLAVRLDAPLLEDVTSLGVQDGKVIATRFSYLARVTESVRAESLPVVISVKPNAFPAAAPEGAGTVGTASIAFRPGDTRVSVSDRQGAKGGSVSLDEATVIVAGGRGVGSAEGFAGLVEPLAELLGAGVGATRAVVDAGWRPFAEQIGQTGRTVSPELYFALGISGAVQHLSGMNRSKVIVAINRDADAPIFRISDYGIVGDASQIIPELLEAVRRTRG
jgi:electron transfer flavoprotein alpha subunit